jgi:hypothetical protein
MASTALKRSLVAAIIIVAVVASARAQVSWLNPLGDMGVSLMIQKADFNGYSHLNFPTSVWSLTTRLQSGRSTFFVIQIPVSNLSREAPVYYGGGTQSETQFGNPYVGMEMVGERSSPMGELGLWLPMAQEDKSYATEIGSFTAFDRFEAFVPNMITLAGKFGYRYRADAAPGVTFKFLAGPSLMMPEHGDAEVFADYNFELWSRYPTFGVGFGFTGRAIVTESDLSFSERAYHQVGFAADVKMGSTRIGGSLKLPVDDNLSHAYNFVFGLGLWVDFK